MLEEQESQGYWSDSEQVSSESKWRCQAGIWIYETRGSGKIFKRRQKLGTMGVDMMGEWKTLPHWPTDREEKRASPVLRGWTKDQESGRGNQTNQQT